MALRRSVVQRTDHTSPRCFPWAEAIAWWLMWVNSHRRLRRRINNLQFCMKLLPRTSTRRTTASFMLAVWLFVLASGFANACLLQAPDYGGSQTSSESSHITGQPAATGHDSGESSKAPCLKACDEGTQALQSSNAMDWVDPGTPPFVGVLWNDETPLLTCYGTGCGFNTPPSLSDPPERILYSRWAL